MDREQYRALARVPNGMAQFLLMRDVRSLVRVQFLHSAVDSGLLMALRTPRTSDELARDLGVTRPDILGVLLDIGVTLKELSVRGGRYRLSGRRARALAGDAGDHLAAMIDEMVTYHASVYRDLSGYMRGEPPGAYLGEHASVIARSSRVLEPFLGSYVERLVRGRGALRMLEIGCGSGVYLRYAAQANSESAGVAVELQPAVADAARANLARWGLGGRFDVINADVRDPTPQTQGPFDLITMHNNVYYFDVDKRPALLGDLRGRLKPGGRYVATSFMQGRTVAALDFDIALRCTADCAPLPELGELTAQLRGAGFRSVETERLMPFEPFWAVVGTA